MQQVTGTLFVRLARLSRGFSRSHGRDSADTLPPPPLPPLPRRDGTHTPATPPTPPTPHVALAPGASENGLAVMLGDLVRQNLEAKPKKIADFAALLDHVARVAIVADDAGVALTLVFDGSGLTLHDGIVGIPDVTIRGPSEAIMALSNMPLATPFGLPFPSPGDADGLKTFAGISRQMREGKLHFYGMLFHLPLVTKLTRVMSVNG